MVQSVAELAGFCWLDISVRNLDSKCNNISQFGHSLTFKQRMYEEKQTIAITEFMT